jgi:hypothetical protein
MTPNAGRDAGPSPTRWIPAYSIFLTTTFHASVAFALLWVPPAEHSAVEGAIQLTIERPVEPPPPAIEPPPPLPLPEPPPIPSLEMATRAPPAESAIAEPEPAPEVTQRDFPKPEPVAPRIEQKKPAAQLEAKPAPAPVPAPTPKPAPKPDVSKAAPPTAPSPPPPPPSEAGVDPSKIDERAARVWGTRYLERMGIKPSHQATLTGRSGRGCPLDTEPYKLEIADNKLTVTNNYGVMFSIPVSADGEIYQIFKRPPMAGDYVTVGKKMEYSMKGNLKSGKLEIWHLGCVYTLIVQP